MSDALGKLIRLSNRHKLPVIVHDSISGESAVLMNLDEYEILAELRDECDEHNCGGACGEDDDEIPFDEDFGEEQEDEVSPDQAQFWSESFESQPASKPSVVSPLDLLNTTPPAPSEHPWEPVSNFDPSWDFPLSEESNTKNVPPAEELRYEHPERDLFPAFSPEEGDDEEPIFFEEPVS